ncbi:uncharacterized protein FIBRA_07842 [Fibroporia radiculosa]|uniref:Uncharacterized protein n=1 Tax=Fibroporia radiculosa TaxID=599839 RepID=J4GFP8_9APHY|nr:uncharacterized protein FIBRA_07842 [Fibroporia radiculosa]CCM05613.1 predicted protein [Fibroporia radiculosa]
MSFVKPHPGLSNALLHQLDYNQNSDRIYRIYGRGNVDWGFTPNADMGITFDAMIPRVLREHDAKALFFMYMRLLAAARKVGVSASDLRAQLHAEWGIDPLCAAPPPPSSQEELEAWRTREELTRSLYRVRKIEQMKKLWQLEPKRARRLKNAQQHTYSSAYLNLTLTSSLKA